MTDFAQLHGQLIHKQSALQNWEQNVFGSVPKKLTHLQKDLDEVRRRSIVAAGPSRKQRRIMAQISELRSREEIMEKQR